MNRLNPLYLIALCFSILLVSFFSLSSQKENYSDKLAQIADLEVKASKYKEYKSNWNNKQFVNKTLDLILRNKSFSNQKVLRVESKDKIKLKLISSDPKILNSFLNRILNKKLIIKKLELEKTYIALEIGLV